MKRSPVVTHAVRVAMLAAVAVLLAGCQDKTSEPKTPDDQPATPVSSGEEPAERDQLPPVDLPDNPNGAPIAPKGSFTPNDVDPDPIPIPRIPSPLDLAPPDEPRTEPPPATGPDTSPETPDSPPDDPNADPSEPSATLGNGTPEAPPEKVDLATAMADEVKDLARLDPVRSVWFDKANGRIVVLGRVCQREAWLELFACLAGTKEHEAIVSADAQAYTVHAALLALGATVGHPASWTPEYTPATGTEIEVTVVWKDETGTRKTARAQDWVLDVNTQKAMTYPWVFAGSRFWYDEETDTRHYQAEGGDFICVSNFPTAMLDLPIQSSESNDALQFRAFTERIPPLGTPVALLLTPKVEATSELKAGAEEDAAAE